MDLYVSAKHFDLYLVKSAQVIYHDFGFNYLALSDFVIKDKEGTTIAYVPNRSIRCTQKGELISFEMFCTRKGDLDNGIGDAAFEFICAFLTQRERNAHREACKYF